MLSVFEAFFVWVGIGLGASIAGMIWPFRRGAAGVVLNAAIGIGGAILAALIGGLLRVYAWNSSTSFLFAAVGAITALVIAHVVYAKSVQHHPRGGSAR
jgi:uncharacterized membrane protein YeaQ/YmgE (transglycosylase-associated protein family)